MGGDLLQGTVELMVLKALSLEPMHGWGIGQRLDQPPMSAEFPPSPPGTGTLGATSTGCDMAAAISLFDFHASEVIAGLTDRVRDSIPRGWTPRSPS